LIRGGYIGRMVRVNLTKLKVKVEEVKPDFMVSYVGGSGWGARLIWDEVKPNVHPLSGKNKVVVATGPLTGTLVLGACKTSLSSISPATKLYGNSSIGGMLGVELKQSGFDALIVEGASRKPVYLWVTDRRVEIKDASHLWGLGCLSAEDAIRKELGDAEVSVATIGPAGENLVKFACVMCDRGHQAGGMGIGAVFGSKKLKAIAVKGHFDIPVANMELMRSTFDRAMKYVNYEGGDGGTVRGRVRMGDASCYLCPMACRRVNVIGKTGIKILSPEYEETAFLSMNYVLPSMKDVVYGGWLCDELGMDVVSAGTVIAFAMECYERGLLSREELNGLDLRFGEAEDVLRLLGDVARRRGIGNLLAEGVEAAAERMGEEAIRIAMHVSGLKALGYDVKAALATALAYATYGIGEHSDGAGAITYDLKAGRGRYTEDQAERVSYLQHVGLLLDCLGVCQLPWVRLGLNLEAYREAYEAVVGVNVTFDFLLRRGKAIYDLTRAINSLRGIYGGRGNLQPWFKHLALSGALKGLKPSEAGSEGCWTRTTRLEMGCEDRDPEEGKAYRAQA